MDDDTLTISFGGREYTGRRLSDEQLSALTLARDDAELMMDVLKALMTYAFGAAEWRKHITAVALGTGTLEGALKLLVAFVAACQGAEEVPEHAEA